MSGCGEGGGGGILSHGATVQQGIKTVPPRTKMERQCNTNRAVNCPLNSRRIHRSDYGGLRRQKGRKEDRGCRVGVKSQMVDTSLYQLYSATFFFMRESVPALGSDSATYTLISPYHPLLLTLWLTPFPFPLYQLSVCVLSPTCSPSLSSLKKLPRA